MLLFIYILGVILTKTARIAVIVLTVAAEVIACLGLNCMGAYAFITNGYEKCGYALLISTALLVIALLFAIFKKSLIPLLLNIFGSAGYIYTISVLASIPHTKIPKESTERLMANHYPTIAVTVLLAVLVFLNFFSKEAIEKRKQKRDKKLAELNRDLRDEEKII